MNVGIQPAMSPLEMINSDEDILADLADSPGRWLRIQRQSRKIEIERIAVQLHLRKEVIEALEQDRYDSLPSPVYVAGYLHNYARLLRLDPAPVVNAYHAALPRTDDNVTVVTPPRPKPRSSSSAATWLKPVLALVISAAVLGLLFLGWQNRSDLFGEFQPVTDEVPSAPATLSKAEPSGQASDAVLNEPPAEASVTLTEPDTLSSPATPPSDALAAPVNDDESAIPADVVVTFSGSSWISVTGAHGEAVLNGEMRNGDRHVLKGQPPYKFVIGNAAATKITVAGAPFDVMSQAHGNVARFTLDPTTAPE